MTEKEIKKLNRTQLLAMLLDSYKEIEELQRRLEMTEEALASREIIIDNAGSLADAAMELNHVFAAAQEAADQYLSNIAARLDGVEATCRIRERDSLQKAEALVKDAEAKSSAILRDSEEKAAAMVKDAEERSRMQLQETEEKCKTMEADATKRSEEIWTKLSQGMQELVSASDLLSKVVAPKEAAV